MPPRLTPRVKLGLGVGLIVSIVVVLVVIAYILSRSKADGSDQSISLLPTVIPAAPPGFQSPMLNARFDESKWDRKVGYQSEYTSQTIMDASLLPQKDYYPKFACLGLQYWPEYKKWGAWFSATASQTYPTSSIPIKTGAPGYIFYPPIESKPKV